MAFALLMLAIHQDIQNEVYKEIYDIFGESNRDITVEDLSKLRYLEMVIKETLRLFPSITAFTRDPVEDIKLSKV